MLAAVRSPERLPAAPADWAYTDANQLRVDEAFRLLGSVAARIILDSNPSSYVIDLASQDGALQAVWSRGGPAGSTADDLAASAPGDPLAITADAFGPVNAERYIRMQKALSALLVELSRPGCNGSAALRLRGVAGELSDDIRGESHRQWRF
jgi:hypothetical protein